MTGERGRGVVLMVVAVEKKLTKNIAKQFFGIISWIGITTNEL